MKNLVLTLVFTAFLFACSNEEVTPEFQVQEPGYKIIEKNEQLYVYPVQDMNQLSPQELQQTERFDKYLKEASFYPHGVKRNAEGAIDFSQSLTGKVYTATYAQAQARAMTQETVILSGISYKSAIYELAKGEEVAEAIYNGDSTMTVPSGDFEMYDANNQLVQQPAQGDIDLATLAQSVAPGIYTVEYTLDDESNGTPNRTELTLHIYETMEEVPAELLDRVEGSGRIKIEEEGDEIILVTSNPK